MFARFAAEFGVLVIGGVVIAQAVDSSYDFAALDADKSGAISLAELRVAAPDLTRADFSIYDSDASGDLSRTEFAVFVAERTR